MVLVAEVRYVTAGAAVEATVRRVVSEERTTPAAERVLVEQTAAGGLLCPVLVSAVTELDSAVVASGRVAVDEVVCEVQDVAGKLQRGLLEVC